jgi:hypothetical protein
LPMVLAFLSRARFEAFGGPDVVHLLGGGRGRASLP